MPEINLDEIRSKIHEFSYHELNLAQSQVERDRNNARANRDYPRIQACKDLMRDIDKLRHSPVRMTDTRLPPQQQRPTPPAKPTTVAKPAKPGKPIPAPNVLQRITDGVQGEQAASEASPATLGARGKQEQQLEEPAWPKTEGTGEGHEKAKEALGHAINISAPSPTSPAELAPGPTFRTPKILNAHTVPQLREMCGAAKLSPGGNKAELIARLMNA